MDAWKTLVSFWGVGWPIFRCYVKLLVLGSVSWHPLKPIFICFILQMHFSFATWKQRSARRRVPIDEVAITDAANRSQVQAVIQAVSTIPWEENVHDHYAAIAKELYNKLVELFPQQRKQPRKHYISQQTWMCRASKIALKQALRAARKQKDSEGESILLPQLRDTSQRLRRMLYRMIGHNMFVIYWSKLTKHHLTKSSHNSSGLVLVHGSARRLPRRSLWWRRTMAPMQAPSRSHRKSGGSTQQLLKEVTRSMEENS